MLLLIHIFHCHSYHLDVRSFLIPRIQWKYHAKAGLTHVLRWCTHKHITNKCDYFVHLKSSSQRKVSCLCSVPRTRLLYIVLAVFVVYGFYVFHLMQDHYCDSPINNSAKIPPKTKHTHKRACIVENLEMPKLRRKKRGNCCVLCVCVRVYIIRMIVCNVLHGGTRHTHNTHNKNYIFYFSPYLSRFLDMLWRVREHRARMHGKVWYG